MRLIKIPSGILWLWLIASVGTVIRFAELHQWFSVFAMSCLAIAILISLLANPWHND